MEQATIFALSVLAILTVDQWGTSAQVYLMVLACIPTTKILNVFGGGLAVWVPTQTLRLETQCHNRRPPAWKVTWIDRV